MAKKTKTSVIDFTAVVAEVVKEYGEEVKADAQKVCKQISPEIVAQLKQRSPRTKYAHEHYAEGWTYDVTTNSYGTVRVTVYNATKPQLTHLLENGHEVVAKGKHYGRTNGEKEPFHIVEWSVDGARDAGVGWIPWHEGDANEEEGDLMSNAIFARNAYVEETYGIDITQEYADVNQNKHFMKMMR